MPSKERILHLTLTEQVCQNLQKRIVSQELKPGSRLVIHELAAELGTSLTPVREALRLLEKDGLVEVTPRKGAHVAKPTRKRFEDLFIVRRALEVLAIRLAAPRLAEADFKALEDILKRGDSSLSAGDSESWLEMDDRLHDFIVHKSENEVLVEILHSIRARIHNFRLLTARFPDRARRASQEHRGIVAAFRNRDVEAAERLMMQHIDNTFQAGIKE